MTLVRIRAGLPITIGILLAWESDEGQFSGSRGLHGVDRYQGSQLTVEDTGGADMEGEFDRHLLGWDVDDHHEVHFPIAPVVCLQGASHGCSGFLSLLFPCFAPVIQQTSGTFRSVIS